MECLPKHPILEFNSDTVQAVRKLYGLDTQERMDEAIDVLENWIQKQRHFLKKDFPRRYLEFTIISSKGLIEKAKERLDKTFTFKTILPQFFGDFDMKNDFKDVHIYGRHALLPKLTKDHQRIVIIKSSGQKFEPNCVLQIFRIVIMYLEHIKTNEYCNGFIFIFDVLEADIAEKLKIINLSDLRDGFSIAFQAYGVKVAGVHVLSSSKIIDVLIKLFLPFLSSKISSRIQVHKSIEAMLEHVPSDILPLEYGGKERSFEVLFEQWVDLLSSSENRRSLNEMSKARTEESLRDKTSLNNQYIGLPGSFRILTVD